MFSVLLVLLSLLVSIYNARNHMNNYSNPLFQDKIIVILFMSPFYSICSFIGISYTVYIILNIKQHFTEYINLVRDIYEAFLLFTFFYLIFAYLAYDPVDDKLIDTQVYQLLVNQEHNEIQHVFPFNYCSKPYKLNDITKAKYFVYRCKKFILQFLIVKPSSALLQLFLHFYIIEKSNDGFAKTLYSIIGWVVCISISLTLYYLVLFYHALKIPLAKYGPLLKFLTIKITLFFTFWQKIVLHAF